MENRTVGDCSLNGKIVLVTGGGSGIGLQFCKQALARGALIAVIDKALTEEAEQLAQSNSDKLTYYLEDITNWKGVREIFVRIKEQYGSVPDVYVNGAAIFEPPWSTFWGDEEMDRFATIDINVSAVLKITRMAIQALVSHNKQGVVLNVASMGGLVSTMMVPMYCASKSAVVAFTRSLRYADALEGVKVVAICPGIVDTPLWTEEKKGLIAGMKRESLITGAQVAAAMVELIEGKQYGGGTVAEFEIPSSGDIALIISPEYERVTPSAGKSITSITETSIAEGQVPPFFKGLKAVMDETRARGPWPS